MVDRFYRLDTDFRWIFFVWDGFTIVVARFFRIVFDDITDITYFHGFSFSSQLDCF